MDHESFKRILLEVFAETEPHADAQCRLWGIHPDDYRWERCHEAAFATLVKFMECFERGYLTAEKNPKGLASRMRTHAMIDCLRTSRRRQTWQLTDFETDDLREGDDELRRPLMDLEERDAVHLTLDALRAACRDDDDRRILELLEDEKPPAIARILKLDPTTVLRRIARLRECVGSPYEPEDIDYDDDDNPIPPKARGDKRRSRRRDVDPCRHSEARA